MHEQYFDRMNVIPIFASAGITGFESPASDYRQLPLSLDELLVEHPSATFIGRASGESMQGVGIFDGDILIVDRHVTARDGDVIVANFNGEFVCKLLMCPAVYCCRPTTVTPPCKSRNTIRFPLRVSSFALFAVTVKARCYVRASRCQCVLLQC